MSRARIAAVSIYCVAGAVVGGIAAGTGTPTGWAMVYGLLVPVVVVVNEAVDHIRAMR